MIQSIYAAAFITSIVMLVVLVMIGYRQKITYYLLIFVAIILNNMGCYTVASAQSLEAAVMGNRLIYLGGVFVPILLLFCVLQLCRLPIPRFLAVGLSLYSMIVLYYAFSVEYRNDYYKRIELVYEDGVSYLIKEYGPMHTLFTILLFGCLLCTLGIILYTFFRQKKVSYKSTLSLLLIELITLGCYVGERVINTNVEWIWAAYLLDEILILALIRKIGMYEVSESVANALNEHSAYGYLVFDKKRRYVGSNDTAKKYIPEIADLKIDAAITEKEPFLYEKLEKKIQEHQRDKEQSYLIEKAGRELRCSLKDLYHGRPKRRIGYLIELEDETHERKYIKLINNYNADLEKEVRQKTEHINALQDKLVLGMADMIENRDSNTGGHIKRTSEVIKIFINELKQYEKKYGFTIEFLNYVAKAAPMHDLGKIAVNDQILRKPGKYTPEEFEEMKMHAAKGAEIVGKMMQGVEEEEFVKIAKNVAHYHHEKWNGQGYPEGLSGIAIPPEARIMALADVFDALVSKRCYKEEFDYEKAFQIIEESLGSHFDPELGKLFLRCREQLEAYYDRMKIEDECG